MSADYVTTFEMDVQGDSETSSKLDSLAGKVKNVGDKGEEASRKTSNFTQTMKSSALGITAAATSAVSLYNQYDQLEKRQTAVDLAEKKLTSSKAVLIDAQQRVNEMVSKGITSGSDYESAVLKLQAAQDGLTIAQDKLKQSQGDLSQAQLGFALQVAPTSIAMVTTLTDVFGKLRLTKLANAAATGAEAAAHGGGVASKIAHTAATVAHTVATQAATVATRLFQIAMGPVGWIILGVGAAAAALSTNFFGIRDALNTAGKALGDFLPFLRPVLDGLKWLADTFLPDTSKASESMADKGTEAFSSFAADGGASFTKLADKVDNSTDKMISDIDRLKASMASVGAVPSVGSSASKKSSSKDVPKAFSWIGFGSDIYEAKTSRASIDSGSSAGSDRSVIEIRLTPELMAELKQKGNVDLVFSSH